MKDVLRQKLADAVAFAPPSLTRRDARIPALPRKAMAVIGMRRAGKTCFLLQALADRVAAGRPRESQVYFSFEDERLADFQGSQLAWILEEYYGRFPDFRDRREVTFFFDEIQVVPGWETFVRRILDSEKVEVFVSGSSARMLSREAASALRGRATETVIYPFSFREWLRHRRTEPPEDPDFVPKAAASRMERAFREYLETGGFPEAQGVPLADRLALVQGYVDTCIFRDVVERHRVTNLRAIRRLVRQLLAAPGGLFSVHKFHTDLRSQGVGVSKDSLYEMLSHLEDAFLIRVVPIETSSERQRQVNPRKAYPVDPALIPAFDRSGKANRGHALETSVLVELCRRREELSYVRTPSGAEVDFLAVDAEGRRTLIQVAADLSDPATRDREFRGLAEARRHHPRAGALLLTSTPLDVHLGQADAPRGVSVRTAWQWMLGAP